MNMSDLLARKKRDIELVKAAIETNPPHDYPLHIRSSKCAKCRQAVAAKRSHGERIVP